jgi:hypothetical protein
MAKRKDFKVICGEEYWHASKAAGYLGIVKNTLLKYARAKKITCMTYGQFVLFKKEWLTEFVKEIRRERVTIGFADRRP